MPVPLILLPPSEGKSSGGNGTPWSKTSQSFPELESARKDVIKALKSAMKAPIAERSKLLGVGESKTGEATKANLSVDTGKTLPAIERNPRPDTTNCSQINHFGEREATEWS